MAVARPGEKDTPVLFASLRVTEQEAEQVAHLPNAEGSRRGPTVKVHDHISGLSFDVARRHDREAKPSRADWPWLAVPSDNLVA